MNKLIKLKKLVAGLTLASMFFALSPATSFAATTLETKQPGASDQIQALPIPADTTAPVVSGVTQDANYMTSVTPVITDDSNFTALLNGKPYISGTDVSHDGIYYLFAVDDYGNSTEVNFVIDRTPPYFPELVSPEDGEYLSSTPKVVFDWKDVADGGTLIDYAFEISESSDVNEDGSFVTPKEVGSDLAVSEYEIAGLTEGVYFWHVRSEDLAGNTSFWTEYRTLTVDNTAPVVEAIEDVKTSKEVLVTSEATDNNAVTDYLWEQVSGPGTLTFDADTSHETNIKADVDGDYVVRVTAKDEAGNSAKREFKFTWDTTVSAPNNVTATVNENSITLNWENPADADFAGSKIYRSTTEGELGELIAELGKDVNTYEDKTVLPGVNYYYTVMSLDELENTAKAEQLEEVLPIVDTPQVLTPVTRVAAAQTYTGASVLGDTTNKDKGEVKSDAKEEKKEDKKEEKGLPYFGIFILVLLGLIGLYLLYLQKPEWFAMLAFWKKKKGKK